MKELNELLNDLVNKFFEPEQLPHGEYLQYLFVRRKITSLYEDRKAKYALDMGKLSKELESARAGMREIYEVWAGCEGLAEKTAPEAYQARLILEMKDIASRFKEKSMCEMHNELIMAVESKHNGETRHETALKYIKQAENSINLAGEVIPPEEGK